MIADKVVECAAAIAHGDPLPASVIILRHLAIRPFEVGPDEGSRDAVDCGFHPLAVAVVDEAGDHRVIFLGLGDAILSVVHEIVVVAARRVAAGQVAIGVVPVALHFVEVGDGMEVSGVFVSVTHPGFAGEVAGIGSVGVGFVVRAIGRSACGGGRDQPVQQVIPENLGLVDFLVFDLEQITHDVVSGGLRIALEVAQVLLIVHGGETIQP